MTRRVVMARTVVACGLWFACVLAAPGALGQTGPDAAPEGAGATEPAGPTAGGQGDAAGEPAGGEASDEAPGEASEARPVDAPEPASAPPDYPDDPVARLELAEQAFQNAEFQQIRPLLEPVLLPTSSFADPETEVRARKLLGVGLFFEAQQVTDASARQALLGEAREQFWAALRREPDATLDSLIYPASVVELFESVRQEHADELAQLRAARQGADGETDGDELSTLYFERQSERPIYMVNYLPFGMGQFQNDEPVEGTLFAVGQATALAVHGVGFLAIESLRNDRGGDFSPEPTPNDSPYAEALQWRTVQWVSLGAFVGLYAWSVVDALLDYQPERVRVRTLDAPPPELGGGDDGASLEIGWGGARFSW